MISIFTATAFVLHGMLESIATPCFTLLRSVKVNGRYLMCCPCFKVTIRCIPFTFR